MTDTLAWILLGWLLPIAGCAFCIFIIFGCLYLIVAISADIVNKIKYMLRRR